MTHKPYVVGQSKTVLVFGEDENATAVISTIRARVIRGNAQTPLRFSGPVAFDAQTAEHIRTVVLPLAGEILISLGVPMPSFEASVANVGAASSQDIGMRVTGFSADTSIFLALLSSALRLPVPRDIVATGHIGSAAGDVRMVRSLRAKVEAASADQDVRLLLHPSLDEDMSLDRLAPLELDQARSAIAAAKGHCRPMGIGHISGLLRAVFREEDIVNAALRNDYFPLEGQLQPGDPALEGATGFLCENMESRFWECLERGFMTGEDACRGSLLRERFLFHVRRGAYPEGLGTRLYRTLAALSPTTRRLKTMFPLVPPREVLDVGKLAQEADFHDVRELYAAVVGDTSLKQRGGKEPPPTDLTEDVSTELNHVLGEIAPESLASRIGLPIDTARACYVMESVTVNDEEEFLDGITSFYLHLMAHTRATQKPGTSQEAGPDALALLERTFAGGGGAAAAIAEGKDGVRGGMRFVLDALTTQLKREEQEKHVNAVLRGAVGALDWGRRVEFMTALLSRLRPHLPPTLDISTSERFVHEFEPIVREYVASQEGVKRLLRRM